MKELATIGVAYSEDEVENLVNEAKEWISKEHLFSSMLQQNLRLSIAFVVECFLYEHHCYRKYSDYLDESVEGFVYIFPSILSSMSADIPSARA